MTNKKDKALVSYDEKRLKENAQLGISNVDPADIRPPSILLAQKLSDFSLMVDKNGVVAKVGQYFHTGRLEIFDSFECYYLFAAKSKYTDRRHPEKGELDQYRALGALAPDCSLFAMIFRVSSLYTLSSLFGLAAAQNRPMFSIKVKMETKQLSGEKGDWFVPVCRIVGFEKDPGKLAILEDMARQFDSRGGLADDDFEDDQVEAEVL